MVSLNDISFRFAAILTKKDVNIPNKDTPFDQSRLDTILNIVFGAFGGIALIILILAGIKLMLSQGDPQGTAKARNAIIFAAIGLAISIGALTIVNFVLSKI